MCVCGGGVTLLFSLSFVYLSFSRFFVVVVVVVVVEFVSIALFGHGHGEVFM